MARRGSKISGQWTYQTIEMKESPAWRELSLSARRVLDRLEIEHAHHGGKDNGRLPCTYNHFEEYGMNRKCIGPAIRECEALGFIEVTERGYAATDFKKPSLYRLTWKHTDAHEPTNEWRRIKTAEEAAEVAGKARKRKGIKKQNASGRK